MANDTPRVDAVSLSRHEIESHGKGGDEFVPADYARQIERDLRHAAGEILRLSMRPEERRDTAWIITNESTGRTFHLAAVDGWKVEAVSSQSTPQKESE